MPDRPRVLAYGGGVDSFAALLDGIDRGVLPDVVAFVDVSDGSIDRIGEDPGEWPGTYRHIREVVIPLCRRLGIEFEWIDSSRYPVRDARSLFAWMWARGQIPVAGPKRICTVVAKVERFELWLNDRFPGREVEVWVGFEAGEEDRVAKDPNTGTDGKRSHKRKALPTDASRHNRFPLIERGLCRCRAVALIRHRGYPVPRKSACMGCPYNDLRGWQTFAREQPEHFQRFVELEARKPPTAKGAKLSIMGYKTLKRVPKSPRLTVLYDRNGQAYQAPPLREYIGGRPLNVQRPCPVCGAAVKATKAVGCDYLGEDERLKQLGLALGGRLARSGDPQGLLFESGGAVG